MEEADASAWRDQHACLLVTQVDSEAAVSPWGKSTNRLDDLDAMAKRRKPLAKSVAAEKLYLRSSGKVRRNIKHCREPGHVNVPTVVTPLTHSSVLGRQLRCLHQCAPKLVRLRPG
jgi:hypothetical protein